MNKYLKIFLIIAIVVVLAILGWFWLLPGSSAPVADRIRDGLPFGSGEDVNIPVNQESGIMNQEDSNDLTVMQKFFQVSKDPVAGFVALENTASTTVRYVDRATGHIYDVNLESGEKTKISNRTLPKIYEALFSGDGESALFRSLPSDGDEVNNLSLSLTPPSNNSTSTNELYSISLVNIPREMEAVVTDGSRLYFISPEEATVASSDFSGDGRQTLYSSQFTDWNILPYSNGSLVYTRASYNTPGYAYRISNNRLLKLLGPLNALVVRLNEDGSGALYSFTEEARLRLFASLDNNPAVEILPPSIAEKCVWGKGDSGVVYCGTPIDGFEPQEPDNWYKGITSFSDRIWRFETKVDISEVLVEPEKNFGIEVDVYKPTLSPDEDYLIFINKQDLSLWALRLGE